MSLEQDRNRRFHAESDPPASDPRRPGAHDRDRILYSEAFRRLAGVTQVAGAHEGRVFHNRLLHSLKVGQLARRIAERIRKEAGNDSDIASAVDALGGLDPEVAEAAGLAHDLGHPPFGHIAEKTLDRLARRQLSPANQSSLPCFDGYEGNAQTFRILTQLTSRRLPQGDPVRISGMNLTAATLRAVQKYPWTRDLDDNNFPRSTKGGKKWGAYRIDKESLSFALAQQVAKAGRDDLHKDRSLEAEIMDWADDVTYAVHDLADFHRAGLIPLELLAQEKSDERYDFVAFALKAVNATRQDEGLAPVSQSDVGAALDGALGLTPFRRFSGTREDHERLDLGTNIRIGRYTAAFRLSSSNGEPRLEILADERLEVEVLKQLTWRYVILRQGLATQQAGQEAIVTFLFEHFEAAIGDAKSLDKPHIPAGFKDLFDTKGASKPDIRRIAADIVAGLTEQEAVMLYMRLKGYTSGSLLDLLPR